ncbi:ferritin-like domain-containing protein [Aequorivita sp. SDUM287046]|uniref:Ferritin-like domain-containing protein n=1 Tax=Aequorivita aurantiaca TaxID=3053356 RepID=A0ABT8DD86_9FLAO|nr:ferritin-like domain-containing protein [Aequorivita aurantiaca]MDN3723165.1 ferritin-like domain-containing protein [Aequorivita aurantiaca]
MNFIKILDILSNKDLLNEKGSRRDSFQQFKTVGKGVALASIPFGLAATSSKTKAATTTMAGAAFQASNIDVLNFALTLEYLEQEFYQLGLDSGVIDPADQTVFSTISKHEDSHVQFLLAALGDDAIDKPNFDFTGTPGGLSLDPFNDYPTFMALAQGFEDTGVRAYKGQAGALANDNTLLTYALQIHSVEARHASQVRRMRGEKGWITRNNNTLPDAFSGIYAGEQNLIQGGVDLAGLFGSAGGDNAVTEAFDEPLTMAEVNAIAGVFIVS